MSTFDIIMASMLSVVFAIMLICLLSATTGDIKKMFNKNAKSDDDNIKQRISDLETKVEMLEQQLNKEMHIVVNTSDKTQQAKTMLNVCNIKISAASITHISSQTFEQSGAGDSRIKIIHYDNTTKTDSVYCSFDAILDQISSNFIQINKNQIINLDKLQKVQGDEIYLKGIASPFYISESKKAELAKRTSSPSK